MKSCQPPTKDCPASTLSSAPGSSPVTSVGDMVFGLNLFMDGTYEDKFVSTEVVVANSVVVEEIAL